MEFTKNILIDLKDSGKDICIYCDEISKNLCEYNANDFNNFSRTSYYFWVKNKRPVPLRVVLRIMDDKKLNKIFIKSFSMNGGNKIFFLDDRNLNFCYLLGLILGDGCLVHRDRGQRRNTYYIQITFREKEKAEKIGFLTRNLFGVNSSIYVGKGCYNLCIFSKPLVLILNKKYDIPIGIKYGSICIPKLIFRGNKKMKKSFLKGVFESDGNIYFHRRNKCVQLRQKSNSFLEEIRQVFHELEIYFRDPYYDKANNSWLLWSSKKGLIDNFIKKIVDFKIEAPIAQLDRVSAF